MIWKQSEPLLPVKRQVMARLCQLLDQPPPKYGNNSTTHRSIKMRCQAMKINFWNNFYQDIWRRLSFSARKIYRESFSLVKLELLSTRTRIRIKLPRSQITRLSPKNGTQVLVLHALSNIWSGQPKTVWNYGCVKQGSVDDCCTLVYWFWGCDYVPRGKIIFITIATASHCRVSSIWVTFTLWGHTWKCIIWMFLAVINEHHWKKAVSTPMLFITNIAKGTTYPGVDCFDQSSWFGRFGSVCLVG